MTSVAWRHETAAATCHSRTAISIWNIPHAAVPRSEPCTALRCLISHPSTILPPYSYSLLQILHLTSPLLIASRASPIVVVVSVRFDPMARPIGSRQWKPEISSSVMPVDACEVWVDEQPSVQQRAGRLHEHGQQQHQLTSPSSTAPRHSTDGPLTAALTSSRLLVCAV